MGVRTASSRKIFNKDNSTQYQQGAIIIFQFCSSSLLSTQSQQGAIIIIIILTRGNHHHHDHHRSFIFFSRDFTSMVSSRRFYSLFVQLLQLLNNICCFNYSITSAATQSQQGEDSSSFNFQQGALLLIFIRKR